MSEKRKADSDEVPSAVRSSPRQSIMAGLSFFDIFNYPLTLAELWRYRYGSSLLASRSSLTMHAVLDALAGSPVGEKDGYYFLLGREGTVATRQRRYRLSEAKFAKARAAAKLFGRLPWVRLVAVCNSLAISNAGDDSDIDLFVVCRPGTLWRTRLMMVGALQAAGLRPRPGRHADTFCLSFFLSEDRLDLSPYALRPRDTYLLYWIASLVPLYDAGGVMDRFRAANAWVGEWLPGTLAKSEVRTAKSEDEALRSSPFALRFSERMAKRFQLRRFPVEIRRMANIDSRVVISDDILKFHVNDRRALYEEKFCERLTALEAQPLPRCLSVFLPHS
jgi:hypothetical protein